MNPAVKEKLLSLPMDKAIQYWDEVHRLAKEQGENEYISVVRDLCLNDLFYLLVKICKRTDMIHPWVYARAREVQANPDGYSDIWSREHFKSSIITFGLSIQTILNNPNITIGLFSHTRPIAKAFLRQIMREFESNVTLHILFPDILWGKDVRNSPKWALDINTPILTINGWKNHGDLEVGDKIFGSQGQVITVIGNSGPMEDAECRRVIFDDCELIASSEHLWPVQVKRKAGAWPGTPEIRIYQTDELTVGNKSRRMPPTPSVKMPAHKMPITVDPYILGLWLGDGTAGTNIISMHLDDEVEVLQQFVKAGLEYYIHRKKGGDNFSMYAVAGLKQDIEDIGCLKEKHIPEQYLYGTEKTRLALLQGLMDSDGTCKGHSSSRGMCMFSNTNEFLAKGVFSLATSLGLRPSIIDFMPKQRARKRIYQVYFVGIKSIPPFRSERKLSNCKDKRHQVGRYTRVIEKIESVTVNCIKVDSDDHLYLAGESFVVTHNSEDDGFIVKRSGNPNEATMEAWGLVDGQPTSKHFKILLYDDIVVQASVNTPEMIEKTITALEQSYNLGVTPKGKRRFVGTRWHFNDAYSTIEKRGTAKLRWHPGKEGGTEEGKSVYWEEEVHFQKRRDMGPYTYCFPANTKILTGEWSEKNIEDIKVGDYVIGYDFPIGKSKKESPKSSLVKTIVRSLGGRVTEVVEFTFESGRKIRCTPDHKFFSGRRGKDVGGNDTHNTYSALGFGYRDLHAAIPIYDPRKLHCQDELTAAWLSGLWDGEGSISSNTIVISQSPEHNPIVCERIESALNTLGFDYGISDREASTANNRNAKAGRIYYIKGGRQEKIRFLNICKPARSHKIIRALEESGTRKFGKVMQDKLVSIEYLGEMEVFNIETGTGNYIAEGYAVKNSAQILLNPKADALMGFKREWLRTFERLPDKGMNNYILVDAASSKKKGSDYTAIWVVRLGKDGNYYCIPAVRDRLTLTERADRLFELHRKWKPKQVRYERYGLMGDIEHMKSRMEQENYRFDIIEVGGILSKEGRIGRLLPLFEQGRVFLPKSLHVTNFEKVTVDNVHAFIEEEYMAFPVGLHDDMLDSLARIAEPDLKLIWPKDGEMKDSVSPIQRYGNSNVAWMG